MIWKLLRLLLLIAIGYYLYRALWKGEGFGFHTKRNQKTSSDRTPGPIAEMKKDPACGAYIPENQAVRLKTGNTTHFFCSENCKDKYLQANRQSEK